MPSTRNTRRSKVEPTPGPRLRVRLNERGQRVLTITYTRDHSVRVWHEPNKPFAEQWIGFVDVVGVNEPGYNFPFTALFTCGSAQMLAAAVLAPLNFDATRRPPAPLAEAA